MLRVEETLSNLLKHPGFIINQKDPRTAHRMRLRHAQCSIDGEPDDSRDGDDNGILTSFSISRCRTSMDWTRGTDHSSQDYTLILCPNSDLRLHLRVPLEVDPTGYIEVFNVQCGDCFAFLAEFYDYKVELVGPDKKASFFVTCFTSKAVCAAEEAKGNLLPDVGESELHETARQAMNNTKGLWSSQTQCTWWR